MSEITVLYALSTLAQTCAALAAFVGALGVYRLQSLVSKRQEVELRLRGLGAATRGALGDYAILPMQAILDEVRDVVRSNHPRQGPQIRQIEEALSEWESFGPDHRRSRRLLFGFIAWNLAVIFVALVGFDLVSSLKGCVWTSVGLWVAAVGTVLVTGLMLLEISGFLAEWLRRLGLERALK